MLERHLCRGPVPLLLLAAAVAAVLPSSGYANPITYADIDADTVVFKDPTESSGTDPVPLYGEPVAFGDTLDLGPLNFGATADDSVDITDGQFSTNIWAKDGYFIESIMVSEAVDYTMFGLAGSVAQVDVFAPVFISILEVDGAPVPGGPVMANFEIPFTPAPLNGSEYVFGSDPNSQSLLGNLVIDVAGILASANIDGLATKVAYDMDNTLSAAAGPSPTGGPSAVATVRKKQSFITVDTGIVPEPTAGVMALLSLIGFAGTRFRA
ncbi:MAG: hypothetical protein AAGA92_06160 [Planctomycetota bacterium]